MMLLAAVVAIWVASHAAASAATVPLPQKIYYDLEDAENLFKEHVKKHERNYNIEEYNKRLAVYKESLKKINELNSLHAETVFTVNFFADLTPEERKRYSGYSPPLSNNGSVIPEFPKGFEAPDQLDYRDQGIIGPVLNQGQCGSCAIFSGIANIEAQYAMKHGQIITLSKQQLVDCLQGFTCKYGTSPTKVWDYLAQDPNGSMSEDQYKYVAYVQSKCNESRGVVFGVGGQQLSVNDEETLKSALAQYGPLSVSLQSDSLHNYHGGVYNPGPCDGNPDHAVLLVGYGQDEQGTAFWIIKNSWGMDWGEQGYVRLIRGINSLKMGTEFAGVSSVSQ